MDLYELQEMLNTQNPDKKFTLEFDPICQRVIEIVLTDGSPNVVHHVEHNKVKVTIDGMQPYYFPIQPHRVNYTWSAIQSILQGKKDIFIHENDLKELSEMDKESDDYKNKINMLSDYSTLSFEQIENKITDYSSKK